MKEKRKRNPKSTLFLFIILVFCILGIVVFSVTKKISTEMSTSAIHNLNSSLDLIKNTIESILVKETEFQKLITQEMTSPDDAYELIRSYESNDAMVKLSVILSGETEGISSTGETFSEEGLDFSSGKTVNKLPLSQSYLNNMGAWAYTMKCPVSKNGKEIATLYVEYTFDSFEDALPDGFYNNSAMLYIMDTKTQRFVLKPTGMGERNAGHLNLNDFYRANNILENDLQASISQSIETGYDIMFYHDIQNKHSLIYMWAINDGAMYLIGHVPIEAIQQEGRTVTHNILMVVTIILTAFLFCCILYYFNRREDDKIRKEREAEREIHNKQLAEALHAAQIASKSKTTFLSNMSHDIRTPMNAILGFTTLLAKDADNPAKVQEYTKKITSSGHHLLSLINDVLDVSKIESGKMVLTIGEFTLNNVISSIDAIIRPMAKEKSQNFHISVTDIKHEYVAGDETRVNQILINLLSNAVKYTPENGNIWLRLIGLPQRSNQYEHIRIEVEDDGYGMTPEFLETMFDAFTRAENSTTNKILGTGLGMAITKNIVELMGGTIDVFSEIDKGTLFRVDLELRIPDSQSDARFWKENGISRILAVDDDIEVCKSIQTLMKDLDIQVDIALSGKEALRLAKNSDKQSPNYDIILLDWKMPEMDGAKTARMLRRYIPTSVPILFLTAYDGEQVENESCSMENVGFFTKPFFISAFREAFLKMQTKSQGENSMPVSDEQRSSLYGLHFLAAEDNDINAEILSELLDIENATCEIVENGQLALERFASASPGEFDAILMDVQMPVMNGHEAAKKIRVLDRPDAKKIPIIAMTANAFAEDVKAALNAGMDAHISKPIDMELLKKTINQFIH